MFQPNAGYGLPTVVKNLLIINVVCFLGTLVFVPANSLFGAFYPDSPFFKIWQPITYMFMHADLGHIFFNMFALFMFGPVLENMLGEKRFLIFYFVSGLGALLIQYGVQAIEVYSAVNTVAPGNHLHFDLLTNKVFTNHPGITREALGTLGAVYTTNIVGASGAIYGVLLGFGFLFPNAKLMLLFLPFPIKAKYFIPILIILEIVLGFTRISGSVAHFAHVGGALFGYIMLKIWKIRRPGGMYY